MTGGETMKRRKKDTGSVQLSLFDNDLRGMTDRELIAELTPRADQVAEDWEWSYNMERLYSQLTPHCRRIAAAAVELYRRREGRGKLAEKIRSSMDIQRIMRPYLEHLEVEEFWLLPMSQACRVIKPIRISTGGIDYTLADVRTIMRKLLEVSAPAFAIVHNHPSGNTQPSKQDDHLTEAIQDAGRLFNLTMIDHVIICGENYYSYRDEGNL